ncbi:uncharacterized protein LTR77_002871 [Saxophila tyrrhenica]|uniref:DUF7587 domain-containing protein n=1 Tax=Saxophila tyrrhenica TaxID=1690608 RepID=A0AAV9PGD9_9PEZI|nr:hypothetical protein LTR77_002871 [Saxophila tyrrhenica]
MERLREKPWDLPEVFYRVQYPGCGTILNDGGSLQASDTTTTYGENDLVSFGQSLINQFIWGHRGSPYISVFSDIEHAAKWAVKYSRDHNVKTVVYKIYRHALQDTLVFSVRNLELRRGVRIPEVSSQHRQNGYLCLHRIPAGAVKRCLDNNEVEESKQDMREADRWERYQRMYGPYTFGDKE